MKKMVGLLVALALAIPLAIGAEGDFDCSKAIKTLDIVNCIDQELKQANDQLSKTYQQYLKTLQKMEESDDMPKGLLVEGLRSAQEAWLRYKDLNCIFRSALSYGGSASNVDRASCELRMTKERLKELSEDAEFWKEKGY